MGIGRESQVVASCDICYVHELSSIHTLADFKTKLRNEGWTIGKKTICPECNERRKQLRNSLRRLK